MTKCALFSLVAAIYLIGTPATTLAQGLVGGPPPRIDAKGRVVQTNPNEDERSADQPQAAEPKDAGVVSKSPYGALRTPLSKPFELVPGPPPAVPSLAPARPGRQLDDWLFWSCMVLAFLVGATVTLAVVFILERRSKRRSVRGPDTFFLEPRLFDQIKLYADYRLLLRLAEMFRGGQRFTGQRVEEFRRHLADAKETMLKPSPDLARVDDLLGQARGTMMEILRSDPKTERLDRTLVD